MDLPASTSYSIHNQTKFLVNNEMLSDIAFLVGIEKTKIYGHKQFLSIGIKKDKINCNNLLLIYSFTHLLIYSFTHLLIYSYIMQVVQCFIRCFLVI